MSGDYQPATSPEEQREAYLAAHQYIADRQALKFDYHVPRFCSMIAESTGIDAELVRKIVSDHNRLARDIRF